MKIYLAARYSRREELCGYRTLLEEAGHTITSRWLNGEHQISDGGLSAEASEEARQRFAEEDWEDLSAADCCISFTEQPRSTSSRGGRHVEFGAALAMAQLCIVVGPRENVFHALPDVAHFHTFAQAEAALDLLDLAQSQEKKRQLQKLPESLRALSFLAGMSTLRGGQR